MGKICPLPGETNPASDSTCLFPKKKINKREKNTSIYGDLYSNIFFVPYNMQKVSKRNGYKGELPKRKEWQNLWAINTDATSWIFDLLFSPILFSLPLPLSRPFEHLFAGWKQHRCELWRLYPAKLASILGIPCNTRVQ